jgi:Cd2+/Zn2+-exporting ATPase
MTVEYGIKGLNCANCAAKIQEAANRIEGIKNARVHFALGKITLELTGANDSQAIRELKKTVSFIEEGASLVTETEDERKKKTGLIAAIAGALIYIPALLIPEGALKTVFFLVSYALLGLQVFIDSARHIAKGQVFDENFLMAIASAGALVIGEFPEGVAVMLFFRIGEFLQGLAVEKSRRSIKSLAGLYPDEASLVTPEGEKRIPAADVQVGDILAVRPGEKVCVDGVVVGGQGFLDTQAVTGEPVPRRVGEGDEVLSGCINTQSVIKIKAQRVLSDSAAARIKHMTEDAVERKSRTETAITRFAKVYTPAVIGFSLLLMFIPPLLGMGALSVWVYRGLVFLAASCPCALVLSVPLAYFGGIGRASRQGVLVKGGNYLESFARTKAFVFDKTGTLTEGVFEVTGIRPENGFDADTVLKLAAGAESASDHPIASSIIKAAGSCYRIKADGNVPASEAAGSYAASKDMSNPPASETAASNPVAEDAKEFPGLGASARVEGHAVLAGNGAFLRQNGITAGKPEETGTIVHVAIDGAYAGYITISDKIRSQTADMVRGLKDLGVKYTYLYTGDSESAAADIAGKAGLDGYFYGMRPEDKAEKINELKKTANTAFAGDGINDAPSLAAADTGIAVGGAREIALEAADIAILGSDLSVLPEALRTAKMTSRVAHENIYVSVAVKIAVLALGAAGLASIWAAVVADTALALMAVLNSLRIVLKKLK